MRGRLEDIKGPFLLGYQALILVIFFMHFSGLEAVIIGEIQDGLHIEWAHQAYVFVCLIFFGLYFFTPHPLKIGLLLLNLVLLPFNTYAAFINRLNFGFWMAQCGERLRSNLVKQAIFWGAAVGVTAVIAEALLLRFAEQPWALVAKGVYESASMTAVLPLALIALAAGRSGPIKPSDWILAGFCLCACLLSASRLSILLCSLAILLLYRFHAAKAFAVCLVAFVSVLSVPGAASGPDGLVTYSRLLGLPTELAGAVSTDPVLEDDSRVSLPESVVPTSSLERMVGWWNASEVGWRLLWPLSGLQPDEVGHIGILLYASVFGVVILSIYVAALFFVLSFRELVLFGLLSLVFTDPILMFGLAMIALRHAAPLPSAADQLQRWLIPQRSLPSRS